MKKSFFTFYHDKKWQDEILQKKNPVIKTRHTYFFGKKTSNKENCIMVKL